MKEHNLAGYNCFTLRQTKAQSQFREAARESFWQVTCYQGLKWLMCLFCLQHQLLFSKSALRLTPPLSERRHGQIHHTGVDKPWLVHTRDPIYLSYDISADDRLGKK